jgi:hypothetical protein
MSKINLFELYNNKDIEKRKKIKNRIDILKNIKVYIL